MSKIPDTPVTLIARMAAQVTGEDEAVGVKFFELYMEMSRECRIRDNRGHDYYEMVAFMSLKNRASANSAPVKRVKVGRNDPCPCGSGKKYKNCCGKS